MRAFRKEFIYILFLIDVTFGSRILFIQPHGPKSQKIFFDGIVHALAKADHQVTMITPFARSKPLSNVRDIVLKQNTVDQICDDVFETGSFEIIKNYVLLSGPLCIEVLVLPEVKEVLKEEFDLVILSIVVTQCFLPILYQKKVPFIHANEYRPTGPISTMAGNVEFPSVAFPIFGTIHPMSFMERLNGAVWSALLDFAVFNCLNPRVENEMRELGLYPEDVPSINEIESMSAFQIANSVKMLEIPARPFAPSVIFAGGIHITPPKPLVKEFEDWVTSSGDDGFIFFSLGSYINSSLIGESRRKMFVKLFSGLKQKVLWKWDGEPMKDLPPNVKTAKWLPQTDLLAHPKLRLFITHGGALSIIEVSHYGVPIVGVSVFADQRPNLELATREGWAFMVDWKELAYDRLERLVHEGLRNKRIKDVAKKRSLIMRDRPLTPAEEIVYWVEYVIRHKGAEHLRCPYTTMSWFMMYNMDVWLLVGGMIIVIFSILISGLYLCFKFSKNLFTHTKPKQKIT